MNKVLLAVDETNGSVRAAETLIELFRQAKPETVVLVYVQPMLGRSLVGEGLTVGPEMDAIREALEGTDYQAKLDEQADKILAFYEEKLKNAGFSGIRRVVKEGYPAEEIIACAKDEGVGLIVIGSRGKRSHDFLIGSVSREVANGSEFPVLVAR